MTKISQAFIFAAGRGERMKPLTDSIPKPLVKINNKAIIDYTIEKLLHIPSLKKIIINGFYLAEQIEKHIKNLNNPKIIFSREIEKIETGGGLLFARNKIDFDEPLLTINGDILWQEKSEISDLELLQQSWNYFAKLSKESDDVKILLGLKKTEDFLGYEGEGDFNFDQKTGLLTKFAGSKMSHVFVGAQIIDPKILLDIQQEKCFSMSRVYQNAIKKSGELKEIKAVELPGKYFHIGTVAAIKQTERDLLKFC